MENYCFNQFNDKFSEFIYNLNITFKGDDELDKFNKKLNLINPKKLIKRYIKIMKPFKDQLNSKDEKMFIDNELYVLPDVNMSRLWKQNISDNSKKNIWQYLQMLYVLGEIYTTGETENLDMLDNMLDNTNSNSDKDNTDKDNTDVNNLLKNVNINQLDDKLNNIKKEDISEASDNIKQMFLQSDNKSSNLMCDMINDISSELSNAKENGGNGISNILKIAENVANKFKPKIESDDFDLSELLGSAQNVMSEIYKDEKGGDMKNPMDMLSQLMGNMGNMDNMGNIGNTDNDPSELLSKLMGGINGNKE